MVFYIASSKPKFAVVQSCKKRIYHARKTRCILHVNYTRPTMQLLSPKNNIQRFRQIISLWYLYSRLWCPCWKGYLKKIFRKIMKPVKMTRVPVAVHVPPTEVADDGGSVAAKLFRESSLTLRVLSLWINCGPAWDRGAHMLVAHICPRLRPTLSEHHSSQLNI